MTIDVLLGLQSLGKKVWQEAQSISNPAELFKVAMFGSMLTLGFSSGLQGKELGHIRLWDTILLMTQGLCHSRKPHVVLSMEGRFKGQVARQKHKIPLVLRTKSGIENQQWLMRLISQYKKAGVD
ncbi:hypothetical protein ACA910_004906 [Epithemia clementina (nom. ined.)]